MAADFSSPVEATHIELVQSKKELNACRISYASMKDDPVVFKFNAGVSVVTFDNIKAVLLNSPEGMDYSDTKKGEHDGTAISPLYKLIWPLHVRIRGN